MNPLEPTRAPSIRSQALAISVAWTLVALVFAGHSYFTYQADGRPVPFGHAAWWSVAEWYTWALLTPLVVVVARRLRPPPHLVRRVAALIVLGAVIALLQVTLEYAVDRAAVALTGDSRMTVRVWLSGGQRGAAMDLGYLLPRKFGFSYVTFWAIVFVVHAADYYRLYRERELRSARLEGALATAQLRALQAQIHPHFLFNTLNAIASLIPDDPTAAEEMVEALSDLLRAALDEGGTREIVLARELDLTDQYVRIQQIRFHDRLAVHRHVDPDTLDALVPPLVLQPLVENAIEHGIASRPSGGVVTLRVQRDGNHLLLTVEDNGNGISSPVPARASSGIGLANTRARLESLHGSQARLEVGNRSVDGGGAYARLQLPLRRAREGSPVAGA
ncbi:MAG TPA: sensor histidine kinase, partial [Gemmatimonadaceae bacterium]|nr:sensor histidine kinase [Gemmatimonadaceae bacterium]